MEGRQRDSDIPSQDAHSISPMIEYILTRFRGSYLADSRRYSVYLSGFTRSSTTLTFASLTAAGGASRTTRLPALQHTYTPGRECKPPRTDSGSRTRTRNRDQCPNFLGRGRRGPRESPPHGEEVLRTPSTGWVLHRHRQIIIYVHLL